MDSTDIELLAKSAVSKQIMLTSFMSPYINENDKEPSWDGFIYIFKDSKKTKDNLDGRLPVQVKGTLCSDFSKQEISFKMSTADLNNYLSDGGAILFVVYIDKKSFMTKIYYCSLTPIKLRRILADNEEKKTKSVRCKELPTAADELAMVIVNCWNNCKNQTVVVNTKLKSIDDYKDEGVLEGITIPLIGIGNKNIQDVCLESELYLYAKLKGSDILHPLDILPHSMETLETLYRKISVDGVVYYSSFTLVRTKDSYKIIIGKSTHLIYIKAEDKWGFEYKESNMLRHLSQDLDFFLRVIRKGGFEINDRPLSCDLRNEMDEEYVRKATKRLEVVKQCVAVLDALHCDKDLDIRQLKDNDLRNLDKLIRAFVKKECIKGIRKDEHEISCISVASLTFAIFITKIDEKTYRIEDFFDTPLITTYENEDGRRLPTSKFAVFKAEDLLRLDNLRSDMMLQSFKDVIDRENYHDAVAFMLELIKAYDMSDDLRKDLLNIAKSFSEWLVNEYPDEIVAFLNDVQITKRIRELSLEEKTRLWEIATTSEIDDECRVGSYLLLDQMIPAKQLMDSWPESKRSMFREYPIYRFWQD